MVILQKVILYLIRHAKTERQSESGRDFDRSLMPRGKRQAEALAGYLEKEKIVIGKILCSSANRTRETLSLLRLNAEVEYMRDLYLSNHIEMLRIINSQSTKGNLMLMGHNEGISDLASYLSGQSIHMQTGMIVILEFKGGLWSELSGGTASLIGMYRSSTD